MPWAWTCHCSRRELLTRAGVGALALPATVAGPAAADTLPDRALLTQLLVTELLVVFTYEHILALGLLGPHAAVATTILGFERAHVSRLGALAGPGVHPPNSVADADRQLAARHSSGTLEQLRTQADALRLLYDIESIAIGAYYRAISKLRDPAALHAAAQIMGAEAQHATVVGVLLHPGKVDKAVPVTPVKGKQ
jgi:hypothetical protein